MFKTFSLAGLVFIVAGAIILIISFHNIRLYAFTQKNKLIKKGIYAHIRNPIYLGLMLISFGSIFLSFSIYIIVYVITLISLYFIVIKFEERELAHRFGRDYEIYKRRVSSLIPKIY